MPAYSTILVPAVVVSLMFVVTDRVSIPSCGRVIPIGGADVRRDGNDELRVMLVGDLMLSGDDSGLRDTYFRDYYLSQFFRVNSLLPLSEIGRPCSCNFLWVSVAVRKLSAFEKISSSVLSGSVLETLVFGEYSGSSHFELVLLSPVHNLWSTIQQKSIQALKPDIMIFLGDISARGWKLTRKQWISVIHQFNRVIGAYVGIPFHVVLGDKDIGNCSGLDAQFVSWIAGRFPGLDSAGCGAFEINNVAFVSLNSVALLCGDSALRFGIEQAIEREKYVHYMESLGDSKPETESGQSMETSLHPPWRQNSMPPGSGPVLLLHFPLHIKGMRNYDGLGESENAHHLLAKGSHEQLSRLGGPMPYKLSQSIPPNATAYVFQALRPRIIFSGHKLKFGYYIHDDRTLEVTVPSMSWNVEGAPGFVIATFQNGSVVGVTHCSHTKEVHVLSLTFLLFMMMLIILAKEYHELRILRRTITNHISLAIFST